MELDFDVVDLGPADHPEAGETAPDFTRPLVTEAFWEDVALSTLVAREPGPTVLVFHPMDGAFPATYTWQEIVEREWHEDATVVGCSISTPYAHERLIDERGLGEDYVLYSDPGADVAEQYGIAHELDGMEGVVEPRPAVFVLDDDLTVAYAWVATSGPTSPTTTRSKANFGSREPSLTPSARTRWLRPGRSRRTPSPGPAPHLAVASRGSASRAGERRSHRAGGPGR